MISPIGPSPGRPGWSPRRRLATAAAFALGAVGLNQLANLLGPSLAGDASYAVLVIVPAVLLAILFGLIRWEGRPLRQFGFCLRGPPAMTLVFASLLAFLFVALRIDPGFVLGFGRYPPYPAPVFGFFLLEIPFVALAQVCVFFGYALRAFAQSLSLRTSLLLAALLFAASSTDFPAFRILGTVGSGEYVFTTTAVAFILGMLLGLYFYKSQWSLLGPYVLTAALLLSASLLPVGVQFPDWGTNFATYMVAYAVLLLAVGVGLKEPRLQALRYLKTRIGPRRLRFRQRARDRASLGNTVAGVAVVAVVGFSVVYGLPHALGVPTPFLAIATGSMVPTFHRGEFVVIEHVAPGEIHVGTIIAFDASCLPHPTVHRVIKIVSTGPDWVYQTKGDANPVEDPCTVPYSDVLGAAVFYVPYLGFLILDPLLTASVIALILVVPWAARGARP